MDLITDLTRGRHHLIKLIANDEHRGAISGNWKGIIRDHRGPDERKEDFLFEVSLTVQGNKVTGYSRLEVQNLDPDIGVNYTLSGSVQYRRFLKLDYQCKDPGWIQFGHLLLEIEPTGKKMEGKLVGFGPTSRTIVTADVWIEKVE